MHAIKTELKITHFYFTSLPTSGLVYLLTLFKLDPDTSIILNLLDHLSVPADDDANSKSGHNHLDERNSEKITKKNSLM